MSSSSIEWTDDTWNPVAGCTKVSAGCKNCYAETMAARHVLMSRAQGRESPYLPVVDEQRRRWSGRAVAVPERLADPLSWRKPRRVFVNSMSDLFHEDVPLEFIAAVFGVMAATPRHTYQVLTKRPARLLEFFAWLERLAERQQQAVYPEDDIGWVKRQLLHAAASRAGADLYRGNRERGAMGDEWPLPNIWLGVSVEDQTTADERIPLLLRAPAAVRFLSCEPLLGPLDLDRWIRRVDHCGSCGAENEPQGPDTCPECGATSCLISTWGQAEAERYRSGERYSPHGEADVAGHSGLNWVIPGGESLGARPCDIAWLRSLVAQARAAGLACFVKQLGSHLAREMHLCDRKGGDPAEWPEDLRVRQWPGVEV